MNRTGKSMYNTLSMPQDKQTIVIACIHPGDAQKQIDVLKKVVDQLNNIIFDSGFTATVRKFRDIGPSAQKMQPRIDEKILSNPDFSIALVNQEFGVGNFQHEVFQARERHIADDGGFQLYIKKPSNPNSEFDEKIKTFFGGEIDFQVGFYNSETDLEKQLTTFIFRRIINDFITKKQNKEIKTASITKSEAKIPNEAITVGQSSKFLISKQVEQEIQDEEKLVKQYLESSSLLYSEYIPSQTLDNHELHLIYKHRKKIKLTKSERKLIIRTAISDQDDLKAGWYWFTSKKDKNIVTEFCLVSIFQDKSEEVRLGSLQVLSSNWKEEYAKLLTDIEFELDTPFLKKLIKILKSFPSQSSIELLDKIEKNHQIGLDNEIINAKVDIYIKTKPSKAIELILEKNSDIYYNIDARLFETAHPTNLWKMTLHKSEIIRSKAYAELLERNLINREKLGQLIEKNELSAVYYGYKGLIKYHNFSNIDELTDAIKRQPLEFSRNPFSISDLSSDSLIKIIKEKMTYETLLSELDWMGDGEMTYQILSDLHFNKFQKHLRKDLQDKFESRKSILIQKFADEIGADVEKIEKKLEEKDINGFIQNKFIASGLKGLSKHGNKSDISIAQIYSSSEDKMVREEALELLAKFGNDSDLEYIIEYATKENNYRTKYYLNLVLSKISNPEKVIEKLLGYENSKTVEASLALAIQMEFKLDTSKVKKLLFSETDSVRELATVYLIQTFTRRKSIATLNEYTDSPTYYYNVVSLLDKLLYSPKEIRENKLNILMKKIM